MRYIKFFREITIKDIPLVGGKNASLGEMVRKLGRQINIPDGFAVTADGYRYFLDKAGINEVIQRELKGLDTKNMRQLAERGRKIRETILSVEFPEDLEEEIIGAYHKLSGSSSSRPPPRLRQGYGGPKAQPSPKGRGGLVDVAVRSSATAEDLPDASFAGQQESYLNVSGEAALLLSVKKCMASLFTDRAISYRVDKGFNHKKVALSVGVQKMVRSDLASAGVMFTLDTDSGFRDVALINASYGLGELVVKGQVNPDEYYVFKPLLSRPTKVGPRFSKKGYRPIVGKTIGAKIEKMVYAVGETNPVKRVPVPVEEQKKLVLSDEEILQLARWGVIIEKHYKRPMDIEWAKDGRDNKLYIVQARPETVHARKNLSVLQEFKIKKRGAILTQGQAIGAKIGIGKIHVIKDASHISEFKTGELLVTEMTDPDWEPVMKMAAGIVANAGGRTCFTGDTILLTSRGFLSMEEIFNNHAKKKLKVLSLNKENLKTEWKEIDDAMVREGDPIEVSMSQTGRMRSNTIKLTPDHKVLTFENRKLVSREIKDLINKKEFIISVQNISALGHANLNPKLGYFLGGISTDGSVYLSKTHGEVQFIQKPTKEKEAFIKAMGDCLNELFNYSFHTHKKKASSGFIRSRKAVGRANAYRCFSKEISATLIAEQGKLSASLLYASPEFVFNFLAGVIDGDGAYSRKSNRINIYCSKDYLLGAVVTACLRLNIPYSVTANRTIHNVQIVGRINDVFKYTKRVKGEYGRVKFGIKLFAAKQLLGDIIEKINYAGRIRPYIFNNLLIDAEKIRRFLIPMIKGEIQNHELTTIVNSDLKMLRANKENDLPRQKVYNITVADYHNYVVFTNKLTPIVVNNCHAAIVARELDIPAIVGAKNGTEVLKTGILATVSCAEGETGFVYKGKAEYAVTKVDLKKLPKTRAHIMMNVGSPDKAFSDSFIPNQGVGLAREEFIINNYIKIHPLALINYKKIKDRVVKEKIDELTFGYKDKAQFFVDKLAEGVGRIAAAFYPKPVIVRLSDFKTNEYANLIGGSEYEPKEDNPMLGWRGASRYYDPKYLPAFVLECKAMKKARAEMGLVNLKIMIPFCRTVEEGKKVLSVMAKHGLRRGQSGLEVYVMAEIPANVILAAEFCKIFDGFSIGSNDLTQLVLGVDRDSEIVSHIYDEQNQAVKKQISELIRVAHKYKRKVGICGQAPSDYPAFAAWLAREGIDSISLTPDSVMEVTRRVARTEKVK